MAQTRRRRRRKHRGTQGGSIDRRGSRGPRPRTRAEARARARKGTSKKVNPRDVPPTWGRAFQRGVFGAVIFAALLIVLFKRPVSTSAPLAAFMLLVYIPLGYSIDRFFYNRRQAAKQRQREQG
jgi:hypothetical protein